MEKGTGSTPRQSFDSAYANLETTVRNFSREKLQYKESINGLKRKLESCEKTLQDNNRVIQTLLTENAKLESIHEEDQTARCAVDAMLAAATMKQEMLSKTIGEFECVEAEILERYVSVVEFIDSLKIRQVQLYDGIGDLKNSLQSKTLQLQEADRRILEISANGELLLEQTKQQLRDHTELQLKAVGLQSEIDSLSSQKNELTQHLQDLNGEMSESMKVNAEIIANNERLFEEQRNQGSQEKMELQQEITRLKSDIDTLTSQANDLTHHLNNMTEKTSELEKKNAEITVYYEQERAKQVNKEEMDKMEFENKTSELQLEIERLVLTKNETMKILNDLELKMDESLESEKRVVETHAKFKQEMEEQTNQASFENKELQKKVDGLQSEIEFLSLQKNELTQHLQELNDKMSESVKENAEIIANVEQVFKEQSNQALNEKIELQQQVTQRQSDIDTLTSQMNNLTHLLQNQTEKSCELEKQNAEITANYKHMMEEQVNKRQSDKMEFENKTSELQSEIESLVLAKNQTTESLNNLKEQLDESERQAVETHTNYKRVMEEQTNQAFTEKMELQQKAVGLQSEIESLSLQKNELTQHLQDLNDKMSESEKRKTRRSSFHLPSSTRRPTAAAIPGILKRSTSDRAPTPRVVSFNKNVEVRKFNNSIVISSSDSDSDVLDMDGENRTMDKITTTEPVQPAKKLRMTQSEIRNEVSTNKSDGMDKEVSMETDNSYSPKKFFKNRTSPLKTYNSCKSPRRPYSASQPN